jgi:hypothetical protein
MDHRVSERRMAEFAACCLSMGQSCGADLHNISAHGCMLATAEPMLAAGNPVRIRIAGISSLDGKVVWAEGACAGVAFATALHPAVVDYIALRTAAKAGEGPAMGQALAG